MARLWRLALPVSLQSMMFSLLGLIDIMMVSQLGTTAVAAVGLGNRVFFFNLLVIAGLAGGVSVLAAQYFGRGEMAGVRRSLALAIVGALLVTLPFAFIYVLSPGSVLGFASQDPALRALADQFLMITGATGDIKGQLGAFRDLGALPDDVDLDWVIEELRLDGEVFDPTQMSQEEMMAELQRITKALLGMGARLPKILMLYVKNLVFLDGAIATLAPDLDIMAEVMNLFASMAGRHGDVLAAQMGLLAGEEIAVDETAVRAAFGMTEEDPNPLTHEELRRRRDMIRGRMGKR